MGEMVNLTISPFFGGSEFDGVAKVQRIGGVSHNGIEARSPVFTTVSSPTEELTCSILSTSGGFG